MNEQKLLDCSHSQLWKSSIYRNYPNSRCRKLHFFPVLVFSRVNEVGDRRIGVKDGGRSKFKWVRKSPNLTEEQKQASYKWVKKSPNLTEEQKRISYKPPFKMTNRCKALMTQIMNFSTENGSVPRMLAAWVKSTEPRRADWLTVLRELEKLNHPLYFEVEYFLSSR